MNGKAHEFIAKNGYLLVNNYFIKDEIIKTCNYPDIYADRNVDKNLVEYLWPLPPKTLWYKKLLKKIEKNPVKILSDWHPVEYIYLFEYYFKKVIHYLRKKERKKASKFAGIFSHFIGDFLQPIHLLKPIFIDFLLEIPEKNLPIELHYKIESVTGHPKIKKNYKPELLGENIKKASMSLYSKLYNYGEEIRTYTLKMVFSLFKNDKIKLENLAGNAVEKATYLFSDFLLTCVFLANGTYKSVHSSFSLIDYPYIICDIDMLYRYRPIKNFSLIPYSGKSFPLSIINNEGKIVKVNGLGVYPYVGPILPDEKRERDAKIEYFILSGTFKKFKGIVGINPLFKNSSGKVVFRIFSNDILIYETKPLGIKNKAIPIEINLPKETKFLTLSMLTVEEPKFPVWINHPHGVWANISLL